MLFVIAMGISLSQRTGIPVVFGNWNFQFVMSEENAMHPEHQVQMLAARETDAFYSTLFDLGWPDAPHRALMNDTVKMWLEADQPPSGHRPGEGDVVAHQANGDPIPRYSTEDPNGTISGDVTAMCMYAGQGIGVVNDVKPVATIMDEMMEVAGAVLSKLGRG